MKPFVLLLLVVMTAQCHAPQDPWQPLLINNSLEGWHIFQDDGTKKGWIVEDQVLTFNGLSDMESGKVDATIRASIIKVNGFVEGELLASKQIEIMSKGRVRGNITNTPGSLVIHDGGIVEGLCKTETAEKMKNLLPQSLPKLLPEETDISVKEIQTTENKETPESPQTA